MPAVASREEVFIQPTDLAQYLDVSRSYLSRATHQDWLAGGVPVAEHADWNRKQTRVKGYRFSPRKARQIIPRSEQKQYDL